MAETDRAVKADGPKGDGPPQAGRATATDGLVLRGVDQPRPLTNGLLMTSNER